MENYTCAVEKRGGGGTGIWCNLELVSMEYLQLYVEMAMEDVELVEKVEFDGNMESWVSMVLVDAAY